MTQREAFEAAHMCTDLDLRWYAEGAKYLNWQTEQCWFTWQASAAHAEGRCREVVEAARRHMEYPDDSERLQALEDALAALEEGK